MQRQAFSSYFVQSDKKAQAMRLIYHEIIF